MNFDFDDLFDFSGAGIINLLIVVFLIGLGVGYLIWGR